MSRTAPPAARLLFADWLRAGALLVMIETHVFNAFLDGGLRAAGWFRALNFVNGLVAPSFLFVSGFVFLVAAERRIAELRSLGPQFRRQVRRILTVWAIGYVMHLPTYVPWRLPRASGAEWRAFFRADVLHCIAATWLFLLAMTIAARSERALRAGLCVSAAALSALAPLAWSVDVSSALAAPLAAYWNNRTGSLFPLVPWSAFMLAGAAVASWFRAAERTGGGERFMWKLAAAGGVMIAAGVALPRFAFLPHGAGAPWGADPRSFLLRLGLVLLLACGCYRGARGRTGRESALLAVSRESLFVYVAHLLLIYGPFWGGRSTADLIGATQPPAVCLAASLLLAAAMTASARAWAIIKQRIRPPAGRTETDGRSRP